MSDSIILFGYSDHGLVVADLILFGGRYIAGYCEPEEKQFNPYQLKYLGFEGDEEVVRQIKEENYFVSIGDNHIRRRLTLQLIKMMSNPPVNVIHPNAYISSTATVADQGVLIGSHCTINACAKIGKGVICNTHSVIEHECIIDDFAHIAPSATLCGKVKVGENTFIGANAVVKQGIQIGKNVVVGAGAVVVKNIPDDTIVVGNPSRKM